MPVVRNIWVDDAGTPLRDEWVTVTLISRAGWSTDGRHRAVRVHSDLTDHTGLWTSPDLPRSSSYEERGTYYRVEVVGQSEHFTVPDTNGPHWLADIRRNPVPIDAEWKVLAALTELPDARRLTTATDGDVVTWDTATTAWIPARRVTAQQLADGLAVKAAKLYVDDADQAMSNRISSLELWRPGIDSTVAAKASAASVVGVADRVTVTERDLNVLTDRVATVEGGGSGGSGTVQHGSLRFLATRADGTTADDHPQYLTPARGDNRYYRRADADSRYAGLNHAARHARDGDDAVTPAAIGAASIGHGLVEHGTTADRDPVRPLAHLTRAAAAAAGGIAHYTLVADSHVDDAPSPNGAPRSLRQPVVHWFELPISPNIVAGSPALNTLFTVTATVREEANLYIDANIFAFMSASGDLPAGVTGQALLTFSLATLAADDTETRVWTGRRIDEINAVAATSNFRTSDRQHYGIRIPGPALPPGARVRLRVQAEKHSTAPANITVYYARCALWEIAAING